MASFVIIMKKLKFKEPYHFAYQNDVDRIVKIFSDRDYDISHSDAVRAWEHYSDDSSMSVVGWMKLGSDDEVFDDAFYYFEEVE